MSPARIGRRQFLQAGAAGLGALAVGGVASGCGPVSDVASADGTPVRFWNLFSGGDGVLLEEILADVRTAAPDIDVTSIVLEWGQPYYTKLAMAASGGRAPEVGILHLTRLQGFAPGGLLEPFDLELLAEFGVTPDQFDPALFERGHHDGELFAIPLDTHPFVAFYDTDLADRAGLLDTGGRLRAFEGPEDMLEANRELAAVTGEYGMAFGHINHDSQAWRMFWSLFSQTGAEFELPPGEDPVIDRDAVVRVLQFLQQLFDGETSANTMETAAAIAAFVHGRAGLIFSGEWELTTFREPVPNLGAVRFPQVFEQPGGAADSHSFILPTHSDRDPQRYRATHEFVARMLQSSMTWAQAGHIPAYRPIIEDAEYRRLDPQADYSDAAEVAALDPVAWFTGSGSEFQRQVGFSVQSALRGSDPGAAADEIIAYTTETHRGPDPTAEGR